jgi:hypothetical protein
MLVGLAAIPRGATIPDQTAENGTIRPHDF